MTFIDWDGKKYLVKVKSYNIFKTISAASTKYHYLCSVKGVEIATKLGHLKIITYTIIKRFDSCGTVEGKKSTNRPKANPCRHYKSISLRYESLNC